jgi:hypothetical protein
LRSPVTRGHRVKIRSNPSRQAQQLYKIIPTGKCSSLLPAIYSDPSRAVTPPSAIWGLPAAQNVSTSGVPVTAEGMAQ